MNSPNKKWSTDELCSWLIERIYHEDNLLAQRTLNLVTANAFLTAALAFSVDKMSGLPYIIVIIGLILAELWVALGRRSERVITFFRESLSLVETRDYQPDRALFDFFRTGEAKTPMGNIKTDKHSQQPMFRTFPWIIPGMSTNVFIGTLIPSVVTLFWVSTLVLLLSKDGVVWLAALSGILSISWLGYNWIWPPASPKREVKNDEKSISSH